METQKKVKIRIELPSGDTIARKSARVIKTMEKEYTNIANTTGLDADGMRDAMVEAIEMRMASCLRSWAVRLGAMVTITAQ